MAAKKKPAAKTAAEPQNKIPEETAKTIMDPDASTAEKLNALQALADNLPEQEAGEEAPASDEHNQESAKEPQEQEKQEATEQEAGKEPEPITSDTPCPFEATVAVALAVLRKTIGLGTSEMLKPVATLKQGTKVTVTAIRGGECLLRNGLWIAVEYLTK